MHMKLRLAQPLSGSAKQLLCGWWSVFPSHAITTIDTYYRQNCLPTMTILSDNYLLTTDPVTLVGQWIIHKLCNLLLWGNIPGGITAPCHIICRHQQSWMQEMAKQEVIPKMITSLKRLYATSFINAGHFVGNFEYNANRQCRYVVKDYYKSNK